MVRAGIRHLLKCDPTVRVLAETGSGSDVVALIRKHEPQIVVIDIRPHDIGVLELIRRVRREEPGTDFLLLTECAHDAAVPAALDAGAKGYLLKTSDGDNLLAAIRRIHVGMLALDSKLVARALPHIAPDSTGVQLPAREQLSARELEVLYQVAIGCTNRSIGAHLGISERTVHSHLMHIFAKMQVNSRVAAVTTAIRLGWI